MGLFGNKEEREKKKREKEELRKQKVLEKELKNEGKVANDKRSIANLEAAKEHLDSDEEIIDFIFGIYDSTILGEDTKRNGVLIATNKRVLFFGKRFSGYEMETIDYNKISSIDYSESFGYGEINIYASGNKIEFGTSMRHKAKEIISVIKEQSNNLNSNHSTAASIQKSPVEQIKEYKELLDMGILTQEEFDKKKKELLNI